MKCKSLLLLLLVGFLSLAPFTVLTQAHDISYNANQYVFTFPTYDTAMAFDSDMIFDTVNRTSDYWYFTTSTVSLIAFRVQNATLLITDFFETNPQILNFSVTAASGITSTTKIYVGDRGNATEVYGETSWSYNSGAHILTVTKTHASTASIGISWESVAGDTEAPTYSNIAHNTTIETTPCKFSSYWDDNVALSKYIFSWNGTAGSWANNSAVSFTSTPAWANVSKTLPSAGTKVGYRWYANDTSNNWATTPISTLTTTATGQSIVVLLGSPSNGSTSYTNTQVFTYLPIFFEVVENASLWTNVGGTWQATSWNTSAVSNNTVNTITYNFTTSGTYLWNIRVYNSTDGIFAEGNRTIIKSLEPRYSEIGYSPTTVDASCTFSVLGLDGDGLSGYIFRTNVTGSWVNDAWLPFSGSPPILEKLATAVKTLPSESGVTVSFLWYINDTDNKLVTTSTYSFQTTTTVPAPGLYIDPLTSLWQFLGEGDLLGMLQALYVMVFQSPDIFYGLLAMLGFGAIYIRTRSLILLSILWLLVGTVLVVALPFVMGLGVVLIILGVAGVFYQLFKPHSSSY